jgi:MFS transporter, DHA1 family, tetracycline resistance protein
MRRVSLVPIFLIVLVDVLGLTIVLPLLPVYGEHFGASALVAALLVPVYSACQLFSGPVLGNLSDRMGRRRVLLLSQAGTYVDFPIIAGAHAPWMLFAGRCSSADSRCSPSAALPGESTRSRRTR